MANSKRSIEKEEFWRLALRESQQCGLTIRAFCQREDLFEPAFYAWRKKLENRQADKKLPPVSRPGKLLPVRIDDLADDRSLEIVAPGGFTLRCRNGVEPARLAALIGVITRCEQEAGSC